MSSKRENFLKSHITKENLMLHRIERSLSLRKTKVEEYLENKRFQLSRQEMEIDMSPKGEDGYLGDYRCDILTHTFSKVKLDEYVQHLKSSNLKEVLYGIVGIRKILSEPNDPPIEEVISKGAVDEIFNILGRESKVIPIVYETFWILTNIASSDHKHTRYICKKGAVDLLKQFTNKCDNIYVKDQMIWLVANIAADDVEYRESLLQEGFFVFLYKTFLDKNSEKIHKTCLWAISNLIRGIKDIKITEEIINLLHICCRIISKYADIEENYKGSSKADDLVPYAISISNSIVDTCPKLLNVMLKWNTACDLLNILDDTLDNSTYLNILRILGNFSSNEHIYTINIVDNGLMPKLKEILETNGNKAIRKEVCWILSNIAAGLAMHISIFFQIEGFVELLFNIVKTDQLDIRKEALWVICNLTSSTERLQMLYLINSNFIQLLSDWILNSDYKISALSLEALENVLFFTNNEIFSFRGRVFSECESTGLTQKLELLSQSDHPLLLNKTTHLLDRYFCSGSEEEIPMLDCENNIYTDDDCHSLLNNLNNNLHEQNKENQDISCELDF
jgi:importin subunit alpha-1